MNIYEQARTLQAETVLHRRFFHKNAETGLDLPKACAYISRELEKCGILPRSCGFGITAEIGHGEPVILLRADMDALPMKEDSGLSFACKTGTQAHTCGHDFHAAMLLTAAKLLKQRENQLQGTVRLMFQPAEELLTGCRNMLDAGILNPPVPAAALACHVAAGHAEPGSVLFNDSSTMMFSVHNFEIRIHGKGAHGAYPQDSIDPIHIGVHIYLAMQALIAWESNPMDACVLTVGQFQAGTALNIIPDTAILRGSLRTNSRISQQNLLRRLQEVVKGTASVYRGSAELEYLTNIPPLCCSGSITREMVSYVQELPGLQTVSGTEASASEDFALIAEQIPSVYFYLTAGFPDERGDYNAHHPKVLFQEDVCPIGSAIYAHCAMRWLEEHRR